MSSRITYPLEVLSKSILLQEILYFKVKHVLGSIAMYSSSSFLLFSNITVSHFRKETQHCT